MTDNEIIKALECCSFDDVKKCDDCPYYEKETKTYCVNDLIKDTLDLINRQKAEIERLTEGCKTQAQYIDHLEQTEKFVENEKAKAKSEAIKEFEKLLTRRLNCNTPRGAYLLNVMNEVKKEMTESK